MSTQINDSYTQLYTQFFKILRENGGKGYSPVILGEVRPFKKEDIDLSDEEDSFIYFYSETEAQILKRQIVKKADGKLLLITAIRPQNIEIISDEEMVKLIVQKIMGDDPNFVPDKKSISK